MFKNRLIPKAWFKTKEEQEEIWKELAEASKHLEAGIKEKNPITLSVFSGEISALKKKLDKAKIADMVAAAKM